jgi:hypothetical protein
MTLLINSKQFRNPISGSFTGSFVGNLTGTSSYAATASYADNFTVGNTLTAQRIVVQTISSSVAYASGSNIFGSLLTNTHSFTGSVGITGSLTVNGISAILGSGTTNYLPKFTGTTALGNSNIQDSGSLITLGSNTTISSGSLGIGTISSFDGNLKITKDLTGSGGNPSGIYQQSTILSDVTGGVILNRTSVSTQAASFTVANINHYFASQGTIGSGSSVNVQYGFNVSSNLIGATTNVGFVGQIPSGTNNWNIYMNGTANNYLAGNLGIGTTIIGGNNGNVPIALNITGNVNSYAIFQKGTVQSDVTSAAVGIVNTANTAASSFTLANYYHVFINQATIGSGSAITNQFGYFADSTLIGATNNYGFYGGIPSGTNRWNLYMNGTANNYIAGSLGIGSTGLTGYNLRVAKNITGNVFSFGINQSGIVQSDVTSAGWGFQNQLYTAAASFTLSNYYHFFAEQQTIGAGSTVNNQYGFFVSSTLTSATNNYGFRGQIPSASNNWNLYMDGTANNYMAGALGIGTTSLTAINLNIGKNITGAVTSYGVHQTGIVQSDVTTQGLGFQNQLSTQATSFTLSEYRHFSATQGTIGAGSVITTQTGYHVSSNLTSATNNWGFRGAIASGTNRYNIYMDGTANNYLAGSLLIGSVTDNGEKLQVTGTTRLNGSVSVSGSLFVSGSSVFSGSVDVTGSLTMNGNILPISDNTITLGKANFDYNTVWTRKVRSSGDLSFQTDIYKFYSGTTFTEILRINSYSASFMFQNGGTFTDNGATLQVNGTNIASASLGRAVTINNTISASANSDVLVGLDINPTFTNGAFTGVSNVALRVKGDISPLTSAGASLGSPSFNFSQGHIRQFLASGTGGFEFYPSYTTKSAQWFPTGNLTLQNGGTFTDAGYRLDVSGSTRLNGTTTIVSASLNYQENLAVTTGSFQTIVSAATGSFRSAFFDYVAYSASVVRAGTVISTWSGSVTEYYENYTNDLGGSTSVVTLQTAISGSNIQLQAGISGSAWSVRSLVRLL